MSSQPLALALSHLLSGHRIQLLFLTPHRHTYLLRGSGGGSTAMQLAAFATPSKHRTRVHNIIYRYLYIYMRVYVSLARSICIARKVINTNLL